MKLTDFLPQSEQTAIVQSIKSAELLTSGEIRVHVEPKCPVDDPYARAVEVFDQLKMYQTRGRNAVLIYLAYDSHKFAIIGDSGINDRVPAGFWDTERDLLAQHLSRGNAGQGVCQVIMQVGEKLKSYFPHQDDDINEQSDEISIGQ